MKFLIGSEEVLEKFQRSAKHFPKTFLRSYKNFIKALKKFP
jgi:hypothetical protein